LAAAETALQELEFAYSRMIARKKARKAKKTAASAKQEARPF